MTNFPDDPDLDDLDRVIAAFAKGEMVVVVDDLGRENEGDLIAAASRISPEQVALMIRHTSGIICAPMTAERAKSLDLPPMCEKNTAPLGTAFTVSVDIRDGVTTGISATERCACLRALADKNATPGDFLRPGHVFPLVAHPGGLAARRGHTEAALELCRAGRVPLVAALSELMHDDGRVMRGPAVAAFAKEHEFKMTSVEVLAALTSDAPLSKDDDYSTTGAEHSGDNSMDSLDDR